MLGDKYANKCYSRTLQAFRESTQVTYKHIVGEYDTASSFALWIGTKIIQNQKVPKVIQINSVDKSFIKNVLIHNYSKEHKHSFILLSAC